MSPPGVRILPDPLLDPVRYALPPEIAQTIAARVAYPLAADQGVKAFRRTSRFRSSPGLHESWKSEQPRL